VNKNTETLSFSPINGAHAITEMVVYIQFTPEFSPATIQRLVSLETELVAYFPKAIRIQQQNVEFKAEGSKPKSNISEKLVGIELQDIDDSGNINWMLRTTENSLSIHCLNYSVWEEVYKKIITYLLSAFHHLEGSGNFIAHVGLMFIDRFICEVPPEEACLSELFNENTDWVFNGAFKAENKLWHSHVGWYEELKNYQCLNQLKTSASYADIKGEKKLIVTVDHNAIITSETNGKNFISYSAIDEDNLVIKETIKELHSMNKKVLRELLTVKMSSRINLN
jgi:uncharacterized protein (TIGR04255 family)